MKLSTACFAALAAGSMVCVSASALAANPPGNGVYMRFKAYNTAVPMSSEAAIGAKTGFEQVEDFTTSIEQTLNIGSQSAGAGAGKIAFNQLSFTLPASSLDPAFVVMACSGSPFELVDVEFVQNGAVVQLLHLKLVAIKAVTWVTDRNHALRMKYSFEYGGLQIVTPSSTGGKAHANGWDRVRNVSSTPTDLTIP